MHISLRQRVAMAAVTVITGSLLTACSGGDGTTTLILGTPFPEDHLIQKEVLEDLAADIEEATDGDVKIEFVPGGALGAGDVVYENVVSGAQDAGLALTGYTPGRFPLTEGLEQSFLFSRAAQGTATFWDAYEEFPELRDEYKDTKILGLWTTDIGEIFTSKKKVTSADDMDGLSLRGPSQAQIQLINKMGGSGVILPAADLFDSLDRGVIDGVMVAGSGPVTLGIEDQSKYILRCGCYTSTMFLSVNKDSWDRLSTEQQDTIDELTRDGRGVSMKIAEAYDAAYDSSIDAMVKDGAELTELDESRRADFVQAADSVTGTWIKDREADGLPGQKFYDFVIERAAKNE